MRVFWPLDFPRNSQPGVLVGWRNSELDIFVVDIMNGVDVGFTVKLTTTTSSTTRPDQPAGTDEE